METKQNRREFITSFSAVTASMLLSSSLMQCSNQIKSDNLGDMLPLRPLGSTGVHVTMLGLGGFHFGCYMSEQEAERTVRLALEQGVRFFECAQAYCNGETEIRLGKFLPSQAIEMRLFYKSLRT